MTKLATVLNTKCINILFQNTYTACGLQLKEVAHL